MFMSFNARAIGLNLSAPETIELAASAGFGGVDLMVRDIDDAGIDPVSLRADGRPWPARWGVSDAGRLAR